MSAEINESNEGLLSRSSRRKNLKSRRDLINDEKLEIMLRNSIKSLIKHKFHEFKKKMASQDPTTLKNRVKMLDMGLHHLTRDEGSQLNSDQQLRTKSIS